MSTSSPSHNDRRETTGGKDDREKGKKMESFFCTRFLYGGNIQHSLPFVKKRKENLFYSCTTRIGQEITTACTSCKSPAYGQTENRGLIITKKKMTGIQGRVNFIAIEYLLFFSSAVQSSPNANSRRKVNIFLIYITGREKDLVNWTSNKRK